MGANNEVAGIPNYLILFDGVCNLCNASVNFIIDRDKSARFSFASLQSEVGARLLESQNARTASLESVMLWKDGVLYKKSRAALEIARKLDGIWPMIYVFRIVPTFLRDFIYDFVANNRYRWFGKRDQCRLPEPHLKSRFVENILA